MKEAERKSKTIKLSIQLLLVKTFDFRLIFFKWKVSNPNQLF